MSTRSPIQIYTTCVSSKEYGWALWRPEPSEDLPWAYRLRGVRPGDVGYVDQRGGFVYMFNITCGADAAVNLGRVPHNFTPFDGVPDILRVRNIHPPGAVIASDSFRTVAGSLDLSWKGKPAGISTSCSFQSTTREGGLLVLPDGADSEDLMNYDDFVDYAILHAPSWYEHANNVLRRNIGTDSLYLVTGCDKAETWALAAHSGTGTQTDLSLRLDTTSAAGGGVSYSYRWEHQHSVQGRVSSNILHIKNQCVFARGLRVSVRSGPRSLPRSVKVENPVGQFLAPPKFKGTEKRNGGPVSRLFSRFKSNLSTPRPQNRANSAEMVVSIEPISGRLLSYNPGAIINKYLLEQNPAARVAVTHDSDYHCVLQEGENLPLPDSELIRRVLDRFQVVINSDGVSLVSKTSRSSPNPKRFDSPMVTFMKIPDSRSSRPVSLSCARIQPFSSSNVISQDVPVLSVIPVFSPSDRGSFRSICTAMVSIGNGTSSPPTLQHSAEAASRIRLSPQSLHFSGVAHANGSARLLWHEPGSVENPFMRSLRSRNISNSTPTSVESTLSGYHIPSTPLLEHQRSSQISAINAFVVSWRPSSLDVALSTWKCSRLIRIVVSERIALALSLKLLEGDPELHNAFFGRHLAFVPPDHLFGKLIRCVDEPSVFPDELRDDSQYCVIRLLDHCLLQNKHVILSEDLLTKIHDFFSRVEAYSPDEVVLHKKASTNPPPPLLRSYCILEMYQPAAPPPLAEGGLYGSALQATSYSYGGHKAIVQLLLDNNANVNFEEGWYSCRLQAASCRGHKAIVRLLLDNNANVNAEGGEYGNALQAASLEGHEAIVRLLLDKQLAKDLNEMYDRILGRARQDHHEDAVGLFQWLTFSALPLKLPELEEVVHSEVKSRERKKSVDAQQWESHLQLEYNVEWESSGGHDLIINMLLEHGTDVDAHGGRYSALQEASSQGHEAIVNMLLEHGTDVDAHGGWYSPLQAASSQGHEAIVKMLIEHGANVNAHGGRYSALQAASSQGHEAIVKMLIEHGANVDALAGDESALQQASSGSPKLMLLEHGADVDYRKVKLAHFSMKEYLLSCGVPRFRISEATSRPLIFKTCPAYLLQLNRHVYGIRDLGLAQYAAQHWVKHRTFGDVDSDAAKINGHALVQLTSSPPLYCPNFPAHLLWFIVLLPAPPQLSNPFVTVFDVLHTLHHTLSLGTTPEELSGLSSDIRSHAKTVYEPGAQHSNRRTSRWEIQSGKRPERLQQPAIRGRGHELDMPENKSMVKMLLFHGEDQGGVRGYCFQVWVSGAEVFAKLLKRDEYLGVIPFHVQKRRKSSVRVPVRRTGERFRIHAVFLSFLFLFFLFVCTMTPEGWSQPWSQQPAHLVL